jgi:hypothetical protein
MASLLLSMRDAVFTVSPNRLQRGHRGRQCEHRGEARVRALCRISPIVRHLHPDDGGHHRTRVQAHSDLERLAVGGAEMARALDHGDAHVRGSARPRFGRHGVGHACTHAKYSVELTVGTRMVGLEAGLCLLLNPLTSCESHQTLSLLLSPSRGRAVQRPPPAHMNASPMVST